MHVVWLKRDLRIDDHGPFAEAGRLIRRLGEVTDVLHALHAVIPIQTVLAHMETGNTITCVRDRAWRGSLRSFS